MKIVKEHILFEKFTADSNSDPIHDMRIGIAKMVEDWVNYINNTKNNMGKFHEPGNMIDTYKINLDGTIDVGDIKHKIIHRASDYTGNHLTDTLVIRGKVIKRLPEFINFNNCYGSCYFNVSIIESLRGCPKIIYGHFCINLNKKLHEIDFFPDIVYGNVYCDPEHKDSIEKYKSHVKGKITYV